VRGTLTGPSSFLSRPVFKGSTPSNSALPCYKYPLRTISLSDILIPVRVFKNKWFNRWARGEDVSDSVLFKAAEEILSGKVEADLGGYLFKKRLAQAGRGKRGGYRTIV